MPINYIRGEYRWGDTGKLYKGRGAKKKAQKQGQAILFSQGKIQVKASKRARGYEKQI